MAKDLFLETMSKLREYRLNEELTEEEAVETLQAIDDMVDKTLADASVPEEVEGEEAVETEVPEEAENTSFDEEEKETEESSVDDVELESKELKENGPDIYTGYECSYCGYAWLDKNAEKGSTEECPECGETAEWTDGLYLDESKELKEGSKDLINKVKSIRAKRGVEESISEIMKKSEVKQAKDLQLEEKSFNKFLTKFITENYKNTESMSVKSARLNNDSLKLECEVKFKSGNTKMIEMKLEGIIRTGKPSVLRAKDNGFFKVESKSAPFKFGVVLKEGTLHCNSLSYKFETRINESKKAEVKGRLVIKESLKK